MKKVNLKVLDRITLLQTLPAQGNILTLKTTRELREKISFEEEEQKALKFKNADNQIEWDSKADKGVEIQFSDVEIDLISKELKKLDEDEKLEARHVDLYDKFVN